MADDRIELRGLRAFGRHGVFPHEQRDGQVFVVDVSLEVDVSRAAATDDLADTVDYGRLAGTITEAVSSTRFDLLEALAAHLAELVLGDPLVAAATIRVAKPDAPMAVAFDEVAVSVRRERTR